MARCRNQIIDDITDAYTKKLSKLAKLPTPAEAAAELTNEMEDIFTLENLSRGRGHVLRVPETILPDQIVLLMMRMYTIRNITCGGPNSNPAYDLLCVYVETGPDAGIYIEDENEFYRIAKQFNRRLQPEENDRLIRMLRSEAPRVPRTTDRDLIAVNNGIFNFKTKELLPFSPEYVFMAKSRVDYDPNAKNPVIHNPDDGTDWDVETWIEDLSDDPEIVDVIWEILSAIIRPNVRWNKSAWLYSEQGNNGKGTLCELMRHLCGEASVAAIPTSAFSRNFALEPLTRATAIIVDENDVGEFIDKAANLKAIITNDVIPIDRKFKIPFSYQFLGFMVQCLNEFPRIKDKSDSFYRRQLFIPFEKCFTGRERRYIKDDYLKRPEVLRYVLYRVLHMDFYVLSEPQRCKDVLAEYKEFNDPVRQFFEEFEAQFRWDLLPFDFLYDLYKAWFRLNNPTGSMLGKTKFMQELTNVVKGSKIWYCKPNRAQTYSKGQIACPEPLIIQYGLKAWQNPAPTGGNPNIVAMPVLQPRYRGLCRIDPATRPTDTPDMAAIQPKVE